MANLNWRDLGAIENGLFAKHKWVCVHCGHEEISRSAPKEYCKDCAARKFEQFEQLKRQFNK